MTARLAFFGVLLGILAIGGVTAAPASPAAVASPCSDDSGNRYVDCGNGTVTDNETGLVWLANAGCFKEMRWLEALDAVAGLGDRECPPGAGDCDCGLTDGSSPGDWRLATRDEWTAMIRAADARPLNCSPTLTTDDGKACWFKGCELPENGSLCSFSGVRSAWYWSSSLSAPYEPAPWLVHLANGFMSEDSLHYQTLVWPVRSGD